MAKLQRNADGKLLRNAAGKIIRGTRCCCGTGCITRTASYASNEPVDFGATLPAQGYIVEYVRGAITYDAVNGQGFRVNAISGGYYYAIVGDDGTDIAEAPPQGVYTEETSQAAVEANAGATVTFAHGGGRIGVKLHDDNTADNALDLTDPSPSAPVFKLCPANHIRAKYCSGDGYGNEYANEWFILNGDGTIRTTAGDNTPLPFYFRITGVTYKIEAGYQESLSPAHLTSGYTVETECPDTGPGDCGRCAGPFSGISISFHGVDICNVTGLCKSGGLSQWTAEITGGLGDYDIPDQGTGCLVCGHFPAPHTVSQHDNEEINCEGEVIATFDEISIRVEVQNVFPTGFRIRVDVDIDHQNNCASSVGGTTDYFRGLSSTHAATDSCIGTYTVQNTQPGVDCAASGRLGRGGYAVVTIY